MPLNLGAHTSTSSSNAVTHCLFVLNISALTFYLGFIPLTLSLHFVPYVCELLDTN